MRLEHILQAGIALLVAATPWLVVSIAHAQARVSVPNGAALLAAARPVRRRLTAATILVSLPLAGLALLVAPPSGRVAVAMVCSFIVLAAFGMAALGAIDRATVCEREIASPTRTASLRPRRFDAIVPPGLRRLSYGVTFVGIVGVAWQSLQPWPGQRLLVPIAFAAGAAVFLLLYDAWLRDEVAGGRAEGQPDPATIARRVRRIQRFQLALVAGLLFAGNLVASLDWRTQVSAGLFLSLAGATLGVIGCAQALASGLTARRYQVTR